MNKPNTLKSQRYKDVNKAVLKFIKAVEECTTYNEILNLAFSYENLSKAILSMESSKYFAKLIIHELHFMWVSKIKDIQQTK